MFPSIYFSANLISKNIEASHEINKDSDDDNRSVFRDLSATQQTLLDNSNTSIDMLSANNYNRKATLFKNMCIILKNKVFICSALGLSSLFFVITAVQYWASDYMEQALKVEDTKLVLLSFSIVCVTSPTLGVVLGGWTTSMIGGYESKHSILLCVIYGIFAGLFSVPVTRTNGITEFTIYLWLVLFFGGAIVPAITGIIISTAPNNLRGLANSLTSFLLNLFGFLPAPFVYGMINNAFKDVNNRLAFFCVMNYSFVGVLFLFLACYFRYRHFNEKNSGKSLLTQLKYSSKTAHSQRGSVISDNIAKIFGTPFEIVDKDEERNRIDEEVNEDTRKISGNNINNNETIMTLDIHTTRKKSNPEKTTDFASSLQTPHFNLYYASSEGGESVQKGEVVENNLSFKKDKQENEEEEERNQEKEEFYSSVCSEENNWDNMSNEARKVDGNNLQVNFDKVARDIADQISEKKVKLSED